MGFAKSWLSVIWAACILPSVTAFPTGAGLAACDTMMPQHMGNTPQTSTPPYILEFDICCYHLNTTYNLTLKGADDLVMFKGFFIQARAVNDDSRQGTFQPVGPDSQTRTCSLPSTDENAITHTNNTYKSQVTVTWTSPETDVGHIHFLYTVVKNFSVFWVKINSSSFAMCPGPCDCLSPSVDFSASDDLTVNPPTIFLLGGEFEKFLVEDPAELLLKDVTPTNWDNIEIKLVLEIPSNTELVSESVRASLPNAHADNRISLDTSVTLSTVFTLGNPVFDLPNGSITYLLQRDAPGNLTAVLLTLQYDQADEDNPPPELRHIYMTFNFAPGCGSQTIHIEIRNVGNNDLAPVVNIADRYATFTEGALQPIYVTNGSLTVIDNDNSFFPIKSATVSILHEPGSDISNEELNVKDPHTRKRSMHLPPHIHVSYDISTGVLTLTGDATPEEYSEILNLVTYFNGNEELGGKPFTSRTIRFTVSDGDFSGYNTVIIDLININDRPVITLDSNRSTALIYKEGSPPLGIDATLTVTDPDSFFLHGAIITLCGVVDGDEIVFGIDLPPGVNITDPTTVCFCEDSHDNVTSWNKKTPCVMMFDSKCTLCSNATVIELQGLATVEEYERLLQSIQYFNSRSPALFFPHNKTITITVFDGYLFSAPVCIEIMFMPVNDPPVLQFNPNADPTEVPPLENRIRFLGFIEEDNPVLVFPPETTLVDVDSEFASIVKIWLFGAAMNECIVWNETLAKLLNLAIQREGDMWTVYKVTGHMTFYEVKKFLLTLKYKNNDHTEPVEGNRTVVVGVWDYEGAQSLNVSIYIDVETKNDKPNLDLGVGDNVNDSVTFSEICRGQSGVGIHVVTLPHRIMISDEVEEMHYTTKIVMILRAADCGELDANEEVIYFLGVTPTSINLVLQPDGKSAIATTKDPPPEMPQGIDDLTSDYELMLFNMRYIHIGEEPTLYCMRNGSDHKPLYRFIDFMIFDSGDPPAYRTVTTRITILGKNDQIPVLIVMAAGGCLVPETEAPVLDLFSGIGPSKKKKKKKRGVKIEQQKKAEPLEVLSVDAFGNEGNEFHAGSRVIVKFSVDTNTPVVLRPSDLQRVVSLSPSSLLDLPHIGVWLDVQTLHIIFPIVKNGNMKIAAEELVVTFPSQPGNCDDPDDPTCASICDSSGQSCGITGSYGVYGPLDMATQQPSVIMEQNFSATQQLTVVTEQDFSKQNVEDVEQTRLYDWLLITVPFSSITIAIVFVLVTNCRRKKQATTGPRKVLPK